MGFLLKMIIFGTIGLVILAKGMEAKQETGSNPAPGMPKELATITNVIKSGLNAVQQKQQPEKTIIKRVCKIKPNGDEECKNLPAE